MLGRRRNGINSLVAMAVLAAVCAGSTQAASTAPDRMRVVPALTQLVVGIERHDCGGYRLYAVAGGRRRLLSSQRAACGAALAPDGLHVAYLAFERAVPTLYVEKLDGSSRQAIAACTSTGCDLPGRFLSYAWSPAGDRLVYTTRIDGRSHMRVADLTGKVLADLTPQRSQTSTVFTDPTWSPRGGWITVVKAYWDQSISFTIPGEVDIVRADGRDWRRLSRMNCERPHMCWPSLTWAPDARRLAVGDGVGGFAYAVFTPSGRRLFSTKCARGPSLCPVDVAWSPSGRRIGWALGRELIVATPDLKRIRRIKVRGAGAFVRPAWSRNGRLVSLMRGPHDDLRPDGEVVVMSAGGGKPRSVVVAPRGGWEVTSHTWQTVAG